MEELIVTMLMDNVWIIGYLLEEGRRLVGMILNLVHEMRICCLVTKTTPLHVCGIVVLRDLTKCTYGDRT